MPTWVFLHLHYIFYRYRTTVFTHYEQSIYRLLNHGILKIYRFIDIEFEPNRSVGIYQRKKVPTAQLSITREIHFLSFALMRQNECQPLDFLVWERSLSPLKILLLCQ